MTGEPIQPESEPTHANAYLLEQKVRAMFMQAPTSNLTIFAIAILYYFMLRNRLDPWLLGGWTLTLCAAAGYRQLVWWRYQRRQENASQSAWLNHYTAACTLVGVSWSLIYLFLYKTDDIIVVVALSMLIFGVLSSAVAVFSPHLPAFVLYAAPQVLVLSGTMLRQQGSSLALLTAGLLAYLLMLTVFARNANRLFVANVRLALENQNLVSDLNAEISQREKVIEERTLALSNSNVCLEHEVIERKAAEDRANIQYSVLCSVLDSTPDLIFFKDYRDKDGCYLGCNQAFALFVGRPVEQIIGHSDQQLFGQALGNSIRANDSKVMQADAPCNDEEWVSYPDGHRVLLSTLRTRFVDQDGRLFGVLGISRDITEQKRIEEALKEQQQSLQHLAHHDPLTGLPNRLLLIDRLTKSIQKADRTGKGLAVMFVDLDHFKRINDSLGHTTGDQLLRAVSKRLSSCVREEDTIARLGGDEFTILLEDIDSSADASMIATKLLERFRPSFELPHHELSISTSIGISLFPSDATDSETLLRNADAAMYQAKSEGRNAYRFYSSDMTELAMARVAMESSLYRALNESQFVLHYQPQVDMRSGELLGCEALVRWNHPDQGLLMPGRFIPIAEETGQIGEIGLWVLGEACRQVRVWHDSGVPEMRIAVNLSGRQLLSSNLVDKVGQVLERTGCRGEWLELEITEGFLIQQPDQSRAALQALRNMGVQIAVDDFGTGYSSLSYLKQFPISKLKIDYSFVRDIPFDTNDQAISAAIIALGQSLNLRIVAEGVETLEQANFLIAHGCHEAQGFLYSKPLPAADFAAFCADLVGQADNSVTLSHGTSIVGKA